MTIERTTPIEQLPELLRVDEAARWLGTSKGVIYERCRQHDDAGTRIGRLLRVRRSWLAQMVNGHNGNGNGAAR